MLTWETPLILPETVAFQTLGESRQTVLVSMDSGYLFTCNDTTRAFLEAVDGKRTLYDLCQASSSNPGLSARMLYAMLSLGLVTAEQTSSAVRVQVRDL